MKSLYLPVLTRRYILRLLFSSVAVISISCETDLGEIKPNQVKTNSPDLNADAPGLVISPILLKAIGIPFSFIDTFKGKVVLEIRSGDGSVVLGSSEADAASLNNSFFLPFNFVFSQPVQLTALQKYRIYLRRTSPHNPDNDYVYWRSSKDIDSYPAGINDPFPGRNLDYLFATFNTSIFTSSLTIDQISSVNRNEDIYGFFLSNSFDRWQEFVPALPR